MCDARMRFAAIGDERREAEPGLTAQCPVCTKAMLAKCGRHRVWHWAHRGVRTCDRWWEPETEWHRGWKNQFPKDWQEVIHTSPAGEKHIADVKTAADTVLEFQHSFLHADERESRETFYPKLVWVVDGRRRVRDMEQFFSCLRSPIPVGSFAIYRVVPDDGGALMRDWAGSRVPVYFDFGDGGEGSGTALWRLNPRKHSALASLSPISRKLFLRVHLEGSGFEDAFTEATTKIDNELEVARRKQRQAQQPLTGFQRHLAQNRRARHRF